ncbi:MAG: hypothetical protein AAFV59_07185 [Pseudomonadota bacterium]
MSNSNLPKEPAPLSPWDYWQESMQTWSEFSQRTGKILFDQFGAPSASTKPLDPNSETLASELLRTLSDMNLRHWQNTARLLESYPAWMRMPHSMAGSALVDWFDNYQRQAAPPQASAEPDITIEARPDTLTVPNGSADDLTKIKGIGPKLSKRLNALGIYHFKQIAEWSEDQAQWVDDYLAFKGRVAREAWISQARILSANGSTTVH